jgi:hypothetical protein
MDDFPLWAGSNWFNLIQTVGIMGSLWMAAAAAQREAKAREVENLISLNGQHHALWSGVLQKPELQRIFQTDADPSELPPTVVERAFIDMVFVHFQTGWMIARSGALISLAEMESDIQDFFTLPLPCAFWEKTKRFRNPSFVKFVEVSLGRT